MSCVVGVAHGGTVWLGADSAANSDDVSLSYKTPKVFRRGGMLIGTVHSFRLRDLLHHVFQVPRRRSGQPDDTYLIGEVLEEVRATLLGADFDLAAEFADAESDGAFMIAYHGRLFTIDTDLHAGEVTDSFAAIGTGAPYALGSLHTTAKGELPPRVRVRLALEAAGHCSQTVRPPFRILSIH